MNHFKALVSPKTKDNKTRGKKGVTESEGPNEDLIVQNNNNNNNNAEYSETGAFGWTEEELDNYLKSKQTNRINDHQQNSIVNSISSFGWAEDDLTSYLSNKRTKRISKISQLSSLTFQIQRSVTHNEEGPETNPKAGRFI